MANQRKSIVLALAFLILIALLIMPFEILNGQCQSTLPVIKTSAPLITYNMTMSSPTANTTFTNVMLLAYTLKINSNASILGVPLGLSVSYRIDNCSEVYLFQDQYCYEFIDVTYLKNSIHQLAIFAQLNYLMNNGTIVENKQELIKTYFSVLNRPVAINIASPQNTIYFTNSIPLTIEIDNPSTYDYQDYPLYWQGYSLDNGTKESQNVNDTLIDLTDGFHKLTFHVNLGNMSSTATVSFFVVSTLSNQILMIIVIAIIPSITILSILYIKHRKTAKSST